MKFNPEIFRAYDIRGIYGKDFDADFAFHLGAALVKYLNRKNFLVANDNRSFSVELAESLAKGIANAGGDVEYIGESTMPFFYFVFERLGVNGGIMVTASHNAPEYGGFKIFGDNCRPIDSSSGLENIRGLLIEGDFETSKYGGQIKRPVQQGILKEYVEFIIKKSGIKSVEIASLKIKATGGGMAKREIDLLFNNLGIKNRETDFDIAFLLDGDADRLAVFDKNNNRISPDFVLGLLAKEEIRFFSKPGVVYDLRFSKGVLEKFDERGIKSFRSRVGRTFIREQMVKHKADLGGELSGHILFKENSYFELPLMAILKILKALKRSGKNIDELVKPFKTWFNSGEISIATSDWPLATSELFGKLKERYKDGKIDELDGVAIKYPSWWFNLRPSNTEPVLRLVVEAKTKTLLDEKLEEIRRTMA